MAAGLGTRMKSALPKHLHPLLGRRLVDWVIAAVRPLAPDPLVVVVAPDAVDAFDLSDIRNPYLKRSIENNPRIPIYEAA